MDSLLYADLINAGPDEAFRAIVADEGCASDSKKIQGHTSHSIPVKLQDYIAHFAKAVYRGHA